jgi:hypothetical protein
MKPVRKRRCGPLPQGAAEESFVVSGRINKKRGKERDNGLDDGIQAR